MTVFARPAMIRPIPDTDGFVDVRAGSDVRAGAYPHDGVDLVSRWHRHDLHQLIYASRGTAEIETAAGRYLLPPQQAAIIPAASEHRTTLHAVESVSVYFVPELIDLHSTKILAAPGLIREMILYASRWPIDRRSSDAMADTFFDTLARLVSELSEDAYSLHLPTPTDPVVRDAVAFTHTHLGTVRENDVCQAIGVSARTLRRHFQADLDMSWGRYAHQSRLLSAMALLAQPEPSVLLVAQQVGFDSPSAFNRAFRHATGESPTSYRRRVSAPTSSPTVGSRQLRQK